MEARLNAQQASPAAYAAMIGLETFLRKGSKLEPSLVEPVNPCVSTVFRCVRRDDSVPDFFLSIHTSPFFRIFRQEIFNFR
jgi:hypothetical protein